MYREILTEDHRNAALLVEAGLTLMTSWQLYSPNALRMARAALLEQANQSPVSTHGAGVTILHTIICRLELEIAFMKRSALVQCIRKHWENKSNEDSSADVLAATGSEISNGMLPFPYLSELDVKDLSRLRRHLEGNPYPGTLPTDIARHWLLLEKAPYHSGGYDERTLEEQTEFEELSKRLEWLSVDED